MYVKVKNGAVEAFPYGQRDLMRDNPNTSYPRVMSDEALAEQGLYLVATREIPQPFDPITQNATVIDPVMENDSWVQAWSVTAASPEEVQQRTNDLAASTRAQRDNQLQQTDWMALSDVTMEPYWREYRQQLRDVTAQEGFPFSADWPTKPE